MAVSLCRVVMFSSKTALESWAWWMRPKGRSIVLVPAQLPEARELPQDVEGGLRVLATPESHGPEERQAGEGRLGGKI